MRFTILSVLLLATAPHPLRAQPAAPDGMETVRRHLAAGETDAAIVALQALVRANPNHAAAHNALGSIFNRTGRYAEALPHAEAAVAAAPEDMRYRYNRGVVRAEHGRFAEAIADFDAALAADPALAYGWLERGAAAASLGRLDEARRNWAEARRVAPDLIWTHWYPATGDLLEGDHASAAATFDRVAAAEPGFVPAHLWRVVVHARAGTPIAVPTVDSRDWPAPVLDLFRGTLDEAGLLAIAAEDRMSGDARRMGEALFYLGQHALIAGRREAAADYFRRALAVQAPRHVWKLMAERELAALD